VKVEDYQKFKKLMAVCGITFDKEITPDLLQLYWDILKEYDYEQVEKAVKRVIMTSEFFPRPARIIKAMQENEDDLEVRAELAYSKFSEARRTIGAYQTVIFDDPIIHRIVDQHGGWPEVCMMTKEDEKYTAFKKNFITEYKSFARDSEYWRYPKSLPGITELENSKNGFYEHIPAPVVVGNPRKAFAWRKKIVALEKKQKRLTRGKVVEIEAIKAIADGMRA